MSARGVLALCAATLLAAGCGGTAERTDEVALRVTDGNGARTVRVPAWPLEGGSRVVAMATTHDGRAVVAQADRVMVLGGRSVRLPAHQRVVSLSRDGSTVAALRGSDLRVGPAFAFDPDVTSLRAVSNAPVSVLGGPRQRIVANGLWELAMPRRVWRPTEFPQLQVVDPGERVLASGDELGDVQLLELVNDKLLATLHRRARAITGAEIAALDVDRAQRVAWLDRQGWLTCDDVSAAVLPPAPPALATAVLRSGSRVWALRGGQAVAAHCEDGQVRVTCRISGPNGDLASSALAFDRAGVLAAGLRRNAIVRLPDCA